MKLSNVLMKKRSVCLIKACFCTFIKNAIYEKVNH